jgi:hypothetical protein
VTRDLHNSEPGDGGNGTHAVTTRSFPESSTRSPANSPPTRAAPLRMSRVSCWRARRRTRRRKHTAGG